MDSTMSEEEDNDDGDDDVGTVWDDDDEDDVEFADDPELDPESPVADDEVTPLDPESLVNPLLEWSALSLVHSKTMEPFCKNNLNVLYTKEDCWDDDNDDDDVDDDGGDDDEELDDDDEFTVWYRSTPLLPQVLKVSCLDCLRSQVLDGMTTDDPLK